MKDERIVTKRVTQKMRDTITAALDEAIERNGFTDYGQFAISDSLILLMQNEETKYNNFEPSTDLNEFVYLLNGSYEEEAIHEYAALKRHFDPADNRDTNLMLVRGLHLTERNREWMNPANPESVQRNTALFQSIILLRKRAHPWLLDEALKIVDSNQSRKSVQGFRDPECVDLILDNPDQAEALILAMVERGYQSGMGAFREMLSNDAPALGNGVL